MSPECGIRIEFFGGAKVLLDGQPLAPFATARAHDLFCYLVLNRNKFFRREFLADLFWPDREPTQGCGSLRTELWRIRAAFNKQRMPAGLIFAESGQSVQFSCQAELSIDFETFDGLLADGRQATRMDSLRAATAMYKGELLAGIDDTWCIYHRELYRARYLSALEEMIDHESCEAQWMQAIDLCIRSLIEDPFAEHIHCKLMNSYRQMGNRVAAMRQFQLYCQRLQQAFEIAPMPETIALFDAIVREHATVARAGERRPRGPATDTRARISQALSRIRRDIEHATDAFEYSITHLGTPARNKQPPVQKSNTTPAS
jgi:DNA-binding SARP family transcriptional activator